MVCGIAHSAFRELADGLAASPLLFEIQDMGMAGESMEMASDPYCARACFLYGRSRADVADSGIRALRSFRLRQRLSPHSGRAAMPYRCFFDI